MNAFNADMTINTFQVSDKFRYDSLPHICDDLADVRWIGFQEVQHVYATPVSF